MTISTTTSRWDYTGDGATTDFTYNNRIFEDSDLEVYVDGALQTLNTNYSVTGAGSGSGGEVQFTSAPANDAEIVLIRNVTNTQESDYPVGGPFPSRTLENDIDRRTIVDQQQDEAFNRALTIPKSDQGSPTTELPAKAARANEFLRFDENGNVTTSGLTELEEGTLTGETVKTLYEGEDDTNAFTDSEKTKLAGVESGATADQTDAEIRAAVEAATDSNVFTDDDHTKLDGIEAGATAGDDNAFHDDESGEIAALTGKSTPVDADVTVIEDSAASNAKKKLSWANIKATLKTYFDTLYSAVGHTHAASDVDSGTFDDARIAESNVTQHQGALSITESQISDLDHDDADAIHDNVAGEIAAVTEKASPVSADLVLIEDSESSNAKKRAQVGNLPFGDVSGPASSTDNALARFDGAGGKTLQNSEWGLDDSDVLTAGGKLAMADQEVERPKIKDYGETVNAIGAIGGGTQDIDLTLGNVVTATVDTSETTFTFSNPPASGTAGSFTLILTNGGSQTLNWPASVDWPGSTVPSLTAAGVDILTFITVDGGTTWYGLLGGLDFG